jgi:di/tricarboxylate transporter
MPFDMMFVFGLVVVAVVLFMFERLPVGLVAVLVMVTLMVAGVLTTDEGLSGFSSHATITIGAMFMLSEGVRRTGALDQAGTLLIRAGRGHPWRALLLMMLIMGAISALINNTAAIAIFIPVVMVVAQSVKMSPSKFLMPLSFASMFGGTCTLIGTSTNILVSDIAVKHGLAKISMFELSPVGLAFMAVGFAYLLTIGHRLVPPRRRPDQMSGYQLNKYITDVVVLEDSPLIGKPLREDKTLTSAHLEIVDVFRNGKEIPTKIVYIEPRAGDVLRIHGSATQVDRILEQDGLALRGHPDWAQGELEKGDHVLVEAVVGPDSNLVWQKVSDVGFPERFKAVPLAIQRRGSMKRSGLEDFRLHAGDCLLLAIDSDEIETLEKDSALVLVSQVSHTRFRSDQMPVALLVIAGVVAATALNLAPVAVSALAGVLVMTLTGCLKLEEGIQSVNWEVIMLLAGMIPLGLAMEKTGAAALLAESLIGWLGAWGPHAVLSGLLFVTMMLTAILNNQASAVLLAPMVIEMGHAMSVDPRAFLIAVTYGASLSFITPVGYQTNTMIYGPGRYRFSDFFRVGIGLNILLWVVGSLLIPLVWPFAP